jgi:restriction endonuclease Mrr
MATRADRIYQIVQNHSGRMSIQQILQALRRCEEEKRMRLTPEAVGATIRMDNRTRNSHGFTPRFSTYGEGLEERGYVSINKEIKASRKKTEILANSEVQIPALIEERNMRTKSELREAIKKLTWEQFEDSFLSIVMQALGFNCVEITKQTRDGGKDAICIYQRALVKSKVLVSAKHWKANTVGISEIQRVRGVKGDFDTALIITSSKFTKDAVLEAENVQNQRAVVLVDMDNLVNICFENCLGTRIVEVPALYKIEDEFFARISNL